MIAVVIPFYQDRPGLLTAAIASVLSQSVAAGIVIVVDDGSPISAVEELAAPDGLPRADATRILVERQQNAGPSAARNTGIEIASRNGAEWIAFLDSDDLWAPDHLERAMRCLGCGTQIALSNWYPVRRQDHDAYTLWNKLDPQAHEPLGNDLYRFRGDPVLQEIWNPISKPSTLVYDFKTLDSVRFDTRLRTAEDKLFYFGLLGAGARVGFSSKPTVRAGTGVNIFDSVQFGTPAFLRTRLDQVRCHRFAAALPGMNRQGPEFRRRRRHLVREFMSCCRHMVRHGDVPPLRLVATLAAEEPALFGSAIAALPLNYIRRRMGRSIPAREDPQK